MLPFSLIFLALMFFSNAKQPLSFLKHGLQEVDDVMAYYNLQKSEDLNNRPIIGVLTQPLSRDDRDDPMFKGMTSYIMHSYIQALESAGARTVPLIYDGNLEKQLAKIDKLNGVFYCGGDATETYLAFGKKVFDKVKDINDNG